MDLLPAVQLKAKNTLALPGVAQWLCSVTTPEEVVEALQVARSNHLAVSVLGGGSNTVVNGPVSGLVIHPANKGVEIIDEEDEQLTVRVAAGENWHQLVIHSLQNKWYGLENLALIPGNVGASPIQNIGAYGVELADFLVAVEVFDLESGEGSTLSAKQCELGYRDSVFKHRLKQRVLIWAVHLRLSKVPVVRLEYPELANAVTVANPTPVDVANTVIDLRRAKLPDPEKTPNAGSFFKNPVLSATNAKRLAQRCPDIPSYPQSDGSVKFPAAWLIDRAGWKGVRRGHVGVHDRQALVLTHDGDGCGEELLALASAIAADVHKRYGVTLEMEPVILGSNN